MNIHNPTLKGTQKVSLQYPHKTSQNDQINFGRIEFVNEGLFSLLIQFGPEFTRRNVAGGKVAFACVLQDSRVLNITQDDGNRCRNFACDNGISDRDKVGTLARAKNTEAE